jgi:class 3 adenylate cyclase
MMNSTPQSIAKVENDGLGEKVNDWRKNDLLRYSSHSSLSSLGDHRLEVLDSHHSNDADDDKGKAIHQLDSFQSIRIGETLIERAALTESIDSLSRHVPRCVLMSLKEDAITMVQESQQRKNHPKKGIMKRMATKLHESPVGKIMSLPRAYTYQAALLFVDISGFTSLSQGLDLNILSKSINSYFEAIVDEITAHGGDVLKFAGDAIFAEWRSNDSTMSFVMNDDQGDIKKGLFRKTSVDRKNSFDQNESFWNTSKCGLSLEDCVLSAAICGSSIVQKCADYPIYLEAAPGVKGSLLTTLNVHCGLGVGDAAGVHVGNVSKRREYLILGSAIDQVSDACSAAALGEIRASTEAIKYLNSGKKLQEHIPIPDGEKSVLIASKQDLYFHTRKKRMRTLSGRIRKQLHPSLRRHSAPLNGMDLVAMKHLHKLLKCYVHPVVVAHEDAHFQNSISRDNQNIQERHRAEAELRSVFTIFIKPAIDVTLTGDSEKDSEIFHILNSIMVIITSILDRFKGHLRQYIVDDKGVVVIATFGLRGSTFPNL